MSRYRNSQGAPLLEFSKNKTKADGLSNICKPCSCSRSKKYYSENTEKHKAVAYARKVKTVKDNKQSILALFLAKGCADCGNTDVRVLEFDHLSDKVANVADLLRGGYCWATIQSEIDKCDIVCANCHRIRTYSRMSSYRNMDPKPNG